MKPNGPLKFYTVIVSGSFRRVVTVMPNVTEAFISGLDPYTNYSVKVKVVNSAADKDSNEVMIRTKPSGKCDAVFTVLVNLIGRGFTG